MQNGRAKLPDVFITDKNDTFHFNEGATTGHFRLLALAMRRDEMGNPVPVEGVAPAVSNSFVVGGTGLVILLALPKWVYIALWLLR